MTYFLILRRCGQVSSTRGNVLFLPLSVNHPTMLTKLRLAGTRQRWKFKIAWMTYAVQCPVTCWASFGQILTTEYKQPRLNWPQ